MLGVKVCWIFTNRSVDDLTTTYKKYARAPFSKSFSDDAMKFYMLGRSGVWRGASIVKVNITIESLDYHQKALHIRIKPIFIFYVLLGIFGVSFFVCLWQSVVNGAPPLIYCMIPVLGVILIIFENNEKQDSCMEKLARGAQEDKTQGNKRQGDG